MHTVRNITGIILTLLILCSSGLADITYTFYLDGVDTAIADTIKASVTKAVSLYNQNGSFNKSLYIYYNSGVPTAQANYDGVITFGGSRNTRVALHEILHTLGVGTISAWGTYMTDGTWDGAYANAILSGFDGAGSVLSGDTQHFWPYGLNYDSEDSGVNRLRSIRVMVGLAADMGFVSFVQEPAAQIITAGSTAAFSVTVANASTYAWYKKGSSSPLANGGDIAGATSGTLQIANVSADDEGLYYCVSGGLTSRPAPLMIVPATAQLAGHWQMDGNVDDTDGAMDGYPTGGPAFTPGYIGQAIDLEGADDYITLPAGIMNYDNITIAAWIYWGASGSWQRIYDFGNDTTQYMFLTPYSGSGTLRFAIKNGGSEQIVETSALDIGQWAHVAVTLNGNTGSLYVNGILEAANTSMTINPGDFNPQYNYIGYSQFVADPLFNGLIDDFRLYNYALSGPEVAALAAQAYDPAVKLTITSATAGAEEAGNPAINSFDGDATTRWCNTNLLSNAWIQYDLGAVYSIDEIQLLFFKGTTRTYPIRIQIDDVQVFNGNSTTSSGYWGTAFAPVNGRYVTITMTAANSDSSYWFSICETAIWEASGTPDTTPPAAPTGLTATAGSNSVALNWADNSESDLASYNVKRATVSGGPYSNIATDVMVSAYTDNTVTNGTTYYYVVSAVDASSNESANSSQVSATPTDPSSVTLLQDGFETNFDKWTDAGTTDWDRNTSQKYSGSYSAHAGSSDNDLISDNLNTAGYSSITIDFWFRDDDIDDSDNIYLQLYNGSSYVNFYELGNSTEDTWHHYTVTLTSSSYSQYFRSNFRIKFEGSSIDSGENLWIDDVKVTAQ